MAPAVMSQPATQPQQGHEVSRHMISAPTSCAPSLQTLLRPPRAPPPGHGGSESSSYAARALLQAQLKEALETCAGSPPSAATLARATSGASGAASAAAASGSDDEEGCGEDDREVFAAQDALIERLPKVRAQGCMVIGLRRPCLRAVIAAAGVPQ